MGGLSQVFKASDWPNSNLKDYKKKISCYLRKVALSVCLRHKMLDEVALA